MNYDLRFTIYARLAALLLLVSSFILQPSAFATTPFSYQFYNADGSAQTNVITMTAWPPATNTWTVYGTNIVYGGVTLTLTPNASGFGTNHAYPNTYRLFITNLNSGFFISLPDTTNQVALGTCLTAAPQVAGPVGFYGMVTNWLGFAPSTNNNAGIVAALGFAPATNSLANLTNLLTSEALIAELGFQPATNSAASISNLLNSAMLVTGLGFQPATNTLASITNLLTSAALVAELGFQPATNGILPDLVTNTTTGIGLAFTNLASGSSPSHSLPNGSIILGTNGIAYVRTNAAWVNLK